MFADTGLSSEKTATVNGRTFRFWSVIGNNVSGKIYAQTSVCVKSGGDAPTGYMGAKARLYTSDGTLVNYTGWEYNNSTSGAVLAGSNFSHSSGYYYSKGQAQFYNGQSYVTYTCYQTANFSPKGSSNGSSHEIKKNKSGEIYGSQLFLEEIGIQPDLVLAEGKNGEIGYVKASDLNDFQPSTPEEAIAYQSQRPISRTVPLYASDGETVIDTFIIG